jgi:hypothetical protein
MKNSKKSYLKDNLIVYYYILEERVTTSVAFISLTMLPVVVFILSLFDNDYEVSTEYKNVIIIQRYIN